jgi:hypothetical protein
LYNFGNTTQIIVSLGYRFGFKGKNYLAGLQL